MLDPESDQIREAYARYGAAMYQCQALERRLAMLLATVHGPGPDRSTREEFEALLASLFGKTFGGLLTYFRKVGAIPGALEPRLVEALTLRNRLAHDYFWERAVDLCDSDGRAAMIGELKEAATFLLKLEQDLAVIAREWRIQHGVTDEAIARAEADLLGGAQNGV